MKKFNIYNTNLISSSIALGADYYGTQLDKRESFYLMDTYMDMGGNHIDSAHIYAEGKSEVIIGQWLKTIDRSKVIIATKGAHPYRDNMNISRLSHEELTQDLDESLERLDTDYIDIYWLHRDDEKKDVAGIMESLNEFIKQGKIKNIGASNWKAKRILEANNYCKSKGLIGFCASQIKWSLASSSKDFIDDPTLVEMNEDEFNFYLSNSVAVVPYASQAKGFFAKLNSQGEKALGKAKERYMCPENMEKYNRALTLAKKYNTSLSAIILAYLTSMPFITIPIVGCKNIEQLKDSLSETDITLTKDELQFLKLV